MAWNYPNLTWPDGRPFDDTCVLFTPAPEQIGVPRIVTTTLRKSDQWLHCKLRQALPWAVPILCAMAAYYVSLQLKDSTQIGILIGATVIGTPLLTWFLYRQALRFRHTLAYLSENGIACFECFGSPNNFTRRELLLFSQAKALFTKRNGSAFEFLWKDPQDRLVFRWADSFAGEGIEPPRSHIFHALKAAESTWTSFLVEDATQQLARGGGVAFPLLGQGTLSVTSTHLTWTTPERNHTISREDMELFRCESGIFEITPSYKGEAKGFTGFKIATGQVGNLNALTGLLERYFTT